MLTRSFAFIQLARATTTNTTTTGCPSADATACNYRSVWSLLASCGITLLICVWHAIHPAVPFPNFSRIHCILYRFSLMLVAFFSPEGMIAFAFAEWYKAKKITKRVHERGYMWWTTTHSHFLFIGGFVLRDDTGAKEINRIDEFLSLVDAGELVNPVITERDIKDKSTSDGLAKAILVVQLFWFTTQIIVRLLSNLAVTLVELDTVCMALLTVPLIFLWWAKPRCPGSPHIFYTRKFVNNSNTEQVLEGDGVMEKLLDNSGIIMQREWSELYAPAGTDLATLLPFALTWTTFGALHAIAWNYEFPTEIEKILWRVSSLTLTGTPVIYGALGPVRVYIDRADIDVPDTIVLVLIIFLLAAGVLSRLLLVALMLASLRSLPPSAHEIIPWTTYIPHL